MMLSWVITENQRQRTSHVIGTTNELTDESQYSRQHQRGNYITSNLVATEEWYLG